MSDFASNPDVDALFEDDPGPIDTIDDDDDDDLKIDDAETKVWLVKVIHPTHSYPTTTTTSSHSHAHTPTPCVR